MGQTNPNDIELGSLPTGLPTYKGSNRAAVQPSAPSWASKVPKILLTMLNCVVWVALGAVVTIYITTIIIAIGFVTRALLEPTVFVQRDPPQSFFVRDLDKSPMVMRWGRPQPTLCRYHNWNNCLDWPETEQCKQDICNLNFTSDCHYTTELWECQMCFSDEGEISQTNTTLKEHCSEAKRREEIVWISLASVFGLILLLALGCCIWKQTREKRKGRGIRLRNRRVEVAGTTHVDGANDTVNFTKSARRVPVLPISGSRTSSASSEVDPSTVQARKGSRGSSGSHNTEAGPSSTPIADRIARAGLLAVMEQTA